MDTQRENIEGPEPAKDSDVTDGDLAPTNKDKEAFLDEDKLGTSSQDAQGNDVASGGS